MSSGTNTERITQNNTKISTNNTAIDNFKTAIDNLPSSVDYETVFNKSLYNFANLPQIAIAIKKLPDNFFEVGTDMQHCFEGCRFEKAPMIDTKNVTAFQYCFNQCRSLITAPNYDFSHMYSVASMFALCTSLVNVPIYAWDSNNVIAFRNVFSNCLALSNESLNNIMATLIGATHYTGTKTLKEVGLNSTQATTCQSLSNWNDFINAGWTTGY